MIRNIHLKMQLNYPILLCALFSLTLNPSLANEESTNNSSLNQNHSEAKTATDFVSGPALEARQKLFERIQQAKAQGIGISGYLSVFKSLEEQVKAGENESKIQERIKTINKSINDQMDRAKILKTQRPLPPQGSQIKGSSSSPSSGNQGSNTSALVDKIKDKIPEGMIPERIKERLMNDPAAREKIMEKIKEKGLGDHIPAGLAP